MEKAALFETEAVDDVDKALLKYFTKRPLLAFLGIVIPFVFTIGGIIFDPLNLGSDGVDMYLFLFIVPFFIVNSAYSKIHERLLQEFAKANGFDFYKSQSGLLGLKGSLFERGENPSQRNVMLGVHGNLPIRIFSHGYQTTDARGKTHVHEFTVCEIKFSGLLPGIVLEQNKWFDSLSVARSSQEKIRLQDEFGKHFAVYVERDFEVEAFEIFTPEVMTELMKRTENFSFEFVDEYLYIYAKGTFSTRRRFEKLNTLARYLVEALAPRLLRMHDDVIAMRQVQKESMVN